LAFEFKNVLVGCLLKGADTVTEFLYAVTKIAIPLA